MNMKSVVLENEYIRVEALDQGAKVLSLYDKEAQTEWLWQNPDMEPRVYDTAGFDDEWFGGMDDVFPCDEPEPHRGQAYSDHGFLWSQQWNVRQASNEGVIFSLESHGIRVIKTLRLQEKCFRMSISIENNTGSDFPFMYRLHPAFALSDDLHICMEAEETVADNSFCEPVCTTDVFRWPLMPAADGDIDLSSGSSYQTGQLAFHFARLISGRIVLCRADSGRMLKIEFDSEKLPVATFFLSKGGYRGWHVLALEPSTGMYASLSHAERQQEAAVLKSGECFDCTFLLSVGEVE